mgnify:CR=1 FL=1
MHWLLTASASTPAAAASVTAIPQPPQSDPAGALFLGPSGLLQPLTVAGTETILAPVLPPPARLPADVVSRAHGHMLDLLTLVEIEVQRLLLLHCDPYQVGHVFSADGYAPARGSAAAAADEEAAPLVADAAARAAALMADPTTVTSAAAAAAAGDLTGLSALVPAVGAAPALPQLGGNPQVRRNAKAKATDNHPEGFSFLLLQYCTMVLFNSTVLLYLIFVPFCRTRAPLLPPPRLWLPAGAVARPSPPRPPH